MNEHKILPNELISATNQNKVKSSCVLTLKKPLGRTLLLNLSLLTNSLDAPQPQPQSLQLMLTIRCSVVVRLKSPFDKDCKIYLTARILT